MKIYNNKLLRAMKLAGLMAVILLLHPACTDTFLNVPPQGQQKAQLFWQSESDATKAVDAIYANLRGWTNVAFAPIATESLGSDDAEKGSDPSDATFMNDFHNFTATSTEGQLSDF